MSAAANTNNSTIKVIAYETSDPDVYAVVFKCLEQKVTKTNTCLHIMGDTSGSMQMTMGDSSQLPPWAMAAASLQAPSLLSPIPDVNEEDVNEEDYQEEDQSSVPSLLVGAPPVSSFFPPPPPAPMLAATPSLAYAGPSMLAATPSLLYGAPQQSLSMQRSFSCAATPSVMSSGVSSAYQIDPTSRLGAMSGFLDRILDMYQFVLDTQGVQQDLTISLFSDNCQSYSTLDGLTYAEIREKMHVGLLNNGGTNFEAPLLELKKYREKFSGETDGIFLSDGGHCSTTKTKDQVQAEFAKAVNLAIGIGSGTSDFDEETLVKISDEFLAISDPKRMRDVVAKRAMDLVTMLGRDVVVKTIGDESHVYYSNMTHCQDEQGNPEHKTKEMTMLMEFYMTITPGSKLQLNYTRQDGEAVEQEVVFSEENDNLLGDKAFGDKVLFTLKTLQRVDNIQTELSEISNPQAKMSYIKTMKEEIRTSPFVEMFTNTRLGVYLYHLINQLDRMSLTRDERVLLDLAKNVGSDAFHSTSSDTAAAYCSPGISVSATPSIALTPAVSGTPSCLPLLRAASSSSSATYGSQCLICTNETSHRGVIYVPCGHFRTCTDCTVEWNKTSKQCPYCNGGYTGIILVNLSDEQKKDSWNMKCTTCNSRQIEIVAEECKHVFSCRVCMSRQKKNTGKVCCTVCKAQGIETEVTKYKQIFM